MAIYTRTGDKGVTKVFDSKTQKLIHISKTSRKIKTIGAIDELNSFLGIAKSGSSDEEATVLLTEVQKNLFTINSIIAGSSLRFSSTKTKKIEKIIDKWEGKLPVLKNFIIYGGDNTATHIFYARALCRKAERALVSFSKAEKVRENILTYMNRLSDFLFMLARLINSRSSGGEELWKPRKK